MSRQVKFEYVCRCGHGSGISEVVWRDLRCPRSICCSHCGSINLWKQTDLAPVPELMNADMHGEALFPHGAWALFWEDAMANKPELAAWGVALVILLAALLSGWLGRAMGAAAVLFGGK